MRVLASPSHAGAASSAFRGARLPCHAAPAPRAPPRRAAPATRAVGWDPENILRPPEIGAINRRQYSRKLQADADFLKQEEKRLTKVKEETAAARDARVVPTDAAKLVEFLLSTTSEEMDYELVRCRPQLTPAFFDHLRSAVRDEKFAPRSSADRVAELEGLLVVAEQGAAKADAAVAQLTAPADRLRVLLGAADKKAEILRMAGENELDEPFMALLEQNIDCAREAGKTDISLFLEKLRNACQKFAKVAPVPPPAVEPPVGGAGIASLGQARPLN